MSKKEPIWEKKTVDKRKSVTSSIRTTAEENKIITEKAKQAGMTKTDYIVNACLKKNIQVIPEGKEILAAVQDARNLIREFQPSTKTKDTDEMLSKVINRLFHFLS